MRIFRSNTAARSLKGRTNPGKTLRSGSVVRCPMRFRLRKRTELVDANGVRQARYGYNPFFTHPNLRQLL